MSTLKKIGIGMLVLGIVIFVIAFTVAENNPDYVFEYTSAGLPTWTNKTAEGAETAGIIIAIIGFIMMKLGA